MRSEPEKTPRRNTESRRRFFCFKALNVALKVFWSSKATRADLHSEAQVVKILESQGWKIERNAVTKTQFYSSRLLEAVRT